MENLPRSGRKSIGAIFLSQQVPLGSGHSKNCSWHPFCYFCTLITVWPSSIDGNGSLWTVCSRFGNVQWYGHSIGQVANGIQLIYTFCQLMKVQMGGWCKALWDRHVISSILGKHNICIAMDAWLIMLNLSGLCYHFTSADEDYRSLCT